MCGLIAFRGPWHEDAIVRLIDQARRRGPDMLGIAWTSKGNWRRFAEMTPSWPKRYRPEDHFRGAEWGMAHARLTTSGADIADAQPLLIDDLAFAHNGTVYRHEELASTHNLALSTHNDSEALARLFLATGCDAQDTMMLLEQHQPKSPHAWIAATPERMWIASWGQPLYTHSDRGSEYVSSWRLFGSRSIPVGTTLDWRA